MFQQDAYSFGTQCLLQRDVAHFVNIGRIELDGPFPGTDGTGHRAILFYVVGAYNPEECRFGNVPTLYNCRDPVFHQRMLLT